MKFFTDITTNASQYCLLNIRKYSDSKKEYKKEIFIDPGVYELVKHPEYSQIEKLHSIIPTLPKNEFISIDYPCDMNPNYSDHFIMKSKFNNRQYANNPQYICTIQSAFGSWSSFVREAEALRNVWKRKNKIIGIGNMCRIMYNNSFTDNVYRYICNEMRGKRVHIYGMPLRQIKKYVPMMERRDIEVSVDSTKWTRRVHKNPPLNKKVACTKETRDVYFLEYIKHIKKNGIEVIY